MYIDKKTFRKINSHYFVKLKIIILYGYGSNSRNRSYRNSWYIVQRNSLICLPGEVFRNVCSKENTIVHKCTTATWTNIHELKKQNVELKKYISGDFPDGPVVKNLSYSAGGVGSIPGQGTKIPHAAGQLSRVPHLLSLRASTESPRVANYRAHMPWSLHATTREEKTRTPQLERGPRTAKKDPACLSEDPACGN